MNNQYYQPYPYYNTFYNPYYTQQMMIQQQLYPQQQFYPQYQTTQQQPTQTTQQQQNSQTYISYHGQEMVRATPEQREMLLKQTPDENLQMFKCKDGMKCLNLACIYYHHPRYNPQESK
jgi:hypothetical protein